MSFTWRARAGTCSCGTGNVKRVVLMGIGADEQLGGYSRHRAHFQSAGLEGLVQDLAMELGRISSRNLGRESGSWGPRGKRPGK
ncbi:hypothetical protein AAFF_G00208660 [Aldrovandia affinis]|uniref:Asparagine synthetase domain-containing protein n=1 Tax=Aldrovandia affinis TaxID=143900 RepID=A0AAD7QZZ7_9TELE|nr:hypothetical protein AAFF_G00208660 [Aldrovandia affinis]